MKIQTSQESVVTLGVQEDYETETMLLKMQVTGDKPIVLGSFKHDGWIVSKDNPLVLQLTEEGMNRLRLVSPPKLMPESAPVTRSVSSDIPF